MRKSKHIAGLLLALFIGAGCTQTYIPKQRGYFRVDLPDTVSYQKLNADVPYDFEVSKMAQLKWLKSEASYDWLNISYPEINATIHISYQKIANDLPELINDAHKFVYKHIVKADDIPQKMFYYPEHHVAGVIFKLAGNTASPFQFFSTDSTEHFLRGALYFDCRPNQDSLKPMIEFVEKDIYQIIETLEWK